MISLSPSECILEKTISVLPENVNKCLLFKIYVCSQGTLSWHKAFAQECSQFYDILYTFRELCRPYILEGYLL